MPPSIPAVILETNKRLKDCELDGRIKEIHLGVRRHITIIFNKTVDEGVSETVLNTVLHKFNTPREDVHILECPTFSMLKFTAIPTVTNNG